MRLLISRAVNHFNSFKKPSSETISEDGCKLQRLKIEKKGSTIMAKDRIKTIKAPNFCFPFHKVIAKPNV